MIWRLPFHHPPVVAAKTASDGAADEQPEAAPPPAHGSCVCSKTAMWSVRLVARKVWAGKDRWQGVCSADCERGLMHQYHIAERRTT